MKKKSVNRNNKNAGAIAPAFLLNDIFYLTVCKESFPCISQ